MYGTTADEHGAPTQSDLLSGVWRQEKGEEQHDRDESARHNEVETVVESTTSHVDCVRYVDVRLRATLVVIHVPLHRHPCNHIQASYSKP